MILEIPTRQDMPHYVETVELDGTVYGLEFYWNARAGGWFLTLWNAQLTAPLLSGRRLVLGAQLLGRYRNAALPPGDLLVVDMTGDGVEPGLKDLGLRAKLVYYGADDLAAIG